MTHIILPGDGAEAQKGKIRKFMRPTASQGGPMNGTRHVKAIELLKRSMAEVVELKVLLSAMIAKYGTRGRAEVPKDMLELAASLVIKHKGGVMYRKDEGGIVLRLSAPEGAITQKGDPDGKDLDAEGAEEAGSKTDP